MDSSTIKYKIDFIMYINFILSNIFTKDSNFDIKWNKYYKYYIDNYIDIFENIDRSINEIDCFDMNMASNPSICSLIPLFNTYTKEIFLIVKKIGIRPSKCPQETIKGTGKDNVVTLDDFLNGVKQLKGEKDYIIVDRIEIGSHNNKIYFDMECTNVEPLKIYRF